MRMSKFLKFEEYLSWCVKSGWLAPYIPSLMAKGNAYTTFFISSELVKWKLGTGKLSIES